MYDLQDNEYEQYVKALTAWQTRQTLRENQQLLYRHQQNEAAQAAQAEIIENWNNAVEVARDKYDDFDDVVGQRQIRISQAAFTAIIESPMGPDIAYHIGSHPEIATKIRKMSQLGAIREIGRIESQFLPADSGAAGASEAVPSTRTESQVGASIAQEAGGKDRKGSVL